MMVKVFALLSILVGVSNALDNGLARTPPMGWMAWERFRCNIDCKNDPKNCISENLFMDMADRMVEDGYLDAGYEYVNIDDCWMSKQRDAQGRLQPDPDRFPHGIKYLADYMHKKGLKLGIYADYGNLTCGGYPGSLGHLETDAQTFADWGVDMLKLDGCYSDVTTMKKGYPAMTKYLNATGRPILFSCSWPAYLIGEEVDYKLIAESCNMWRNYDDIQDSWDSVTSIIDYYTKEQDTLAPVQGPGNFNDPDMIIVGNFGLSYEESKAQLAMWTIFGAPLLMSNDLRTIDPKFRELLLNKEVIAINQDPLGAFGKKVLQVTPKIEAYVRDLQTLWPTAFLNRGDSSGNPVNVTVSFEKLGLPVSQVSGFDVLDLFTGEYSGYLPPDASYTYSVPPSGVTLVRIAVAE